MAMKIQVMVLWVVMSCSDVVGYQHFRVKLKAARFSEILVSYHITTLTD
jgi:hypothetical protein